MVRKHVAHLCHSLPRLLVCRRHRARLHAVADCLGSGRAAIALPDAKCKSTLALAGTALLAGFAIAHAASTFVSIGIDSQVIRCLPYSVYALRLAKPAQVVRGDLIVFPAPPTSMPREGQRLIKIAAAMEGDRVRIDAGGIWINEVRWGPMEFHLLRARDLAAPALPKEYTVPPGKLLALGTEPGSWDGRYWGLIDVEAVTATALPLW
ncbi:MAG: hypothetical protein RL684_2472 [Pseudomonadota bacterium]|jgi:conjugal transfer pilin signal peptidase TrbI